MTTVRALAAFGFLLALAAGLRASLAGDPADARDGVGANLLRAAKNEDEAQVKQALDDAAALVGAGKAFPDLGALADWIGGMPEVVTARTAVEVRLGWMYVSAKRPNDALAPLEKALKAEPSDAIARSYLAEAKRQAGDAAGAAKEFARAIGDGAADGLVLPYVRRIVYDLRVLSKPAEGDALPDYAAVAETILAAKDVPDVRRDVANWLAFDAECLRGQEKRSTALRAAAVRHAWTWLKRAEPGADSSRLAYDAAEWWKGIGTPRPADLPDRFDLLALAVRLGERADAEAHEVPEALAAMAETALAKGRLVLAEKMARRRLAISDSPAARRVLLALPPDVGD